LHIGIVFYQEDARHIAPKMHIRRLA
jgi:hypothetical protein